MKKIKVKQILEHSHSSMNDTVINTASQLENAYVIIKLEDLLKERGITQKDLASLTGMRVGTISEIANGKGISWNKAQLLSIMSALKLTNFSQLYEIRLEPTQYEEYEYESTQWIATKEMPNTVKEMYRENLLKSRGLD
ncbi:helix-turn-helix domain-containing protein [Rummeliibacillus pycnus]|uniref:helix-turn-helix domain-containing protein n=1 Tax=Rummeliibacillus pycnus TaxID=101070 RepID=UPI003D2CA703